jgi:hypothetical protein
MIAADAKLLALVGASPPGEKLNLLALRMAVGMSPSEVMAAMQRLVDDGFLDRSTLRPIVKPAKYTELPSAGPELFAALIAVGHARGMTTQDISIALFGNKARIYLLRTTGNVMRATLLRCQAWVGGENIPQGTISALNEHVREAKREIADKARETRRPGETMADRIKRLAAEVDDEEAAADAALAVERRAREGDELATPSSLLRRAERDWPELCVRVRSLAERLGVQLGEAWHRVMIAGVDSVNEAEAA